MAGNVLLISHPASASITNRYDALNRLTNVLDGVGTTSYTYTPASQLLSEAGPWNDDMITYGYTARQRTSLSLQQPNGSAWSQTYVYDGARRLTNVTSQAGGFGFAYDATRNTQLRKLSLPNGAVITNAHDSVARLTATVLNNSTGTALNLHTYSYNVGNQRTSQGRTAGDAVAYTYDNIGQLRTALATEAGGVTNRLQEQFKYGYDAAHNLNARTNNALVQTFNVNSLNELTTIGRTGTLTVDGTSSSAATSVTVNSSAATLYSDYTFTKDGFTLADGNNTFTAIAQDSLGRKDTNAITVFLPATPAYTYDLNGNLLGDGTRCFAYDDENELTSVWVTNTWRSDFVYDGQLRRRVRKEFNWQTGAWSETNEVRYVYDGNSVIQERDGNNLPVVAYTRAGSGMLARSDLKGLAPAHAFYHSDGNGNITALINAQQLIVAKYAYDSYGNTLSQSGPLADANLYRFSSKEFHLYSGTYYYGRRYYEPNLQRWLNRDPIEEIGGLNLFVFVGNNSINDTDPLGLLDYYYSKGGILEPSGPVPYLEADTLWGNALAGAYGLIPLAYNGTIGYVGEALNKLSQMVGELTTDITGDAALGEGAQNVAAVIPWLFGDPWAQCPAAAAEGGQAVTFYSVQSEADAARLASGGTPWPTGLQRANLGEGLYTWANQADAAAYAANKPASVIMQFNMSASDYSSLNTLDMRTMSDEAASEWLGNYSQYGAGQAHGFDHIIRTAGAGTDTIFRQMPSIYFNNMETQFNFLQVKEGITYFARVVVSSDPRIDGIKIAEKAGAQIPSFNMDWLEAARLGAEKALRTHVDLGGGRVGVEVITVLGTEVDTRRDTVEVAAFCAAWKAFGHDESALRIEYDGQWKVCPREAT